jgi:hypothetical protein
LLAGNIFQTAEIFEAGPENSTNHKALLRFRTSAVGDAVGIPFRKVRVHKGIWSNGKFEEPNIQLANHYSQKVVGRLIDRSIWNLAPSDRFIAPEDFIEQLISRCHHRIQWNSPVKSLENTTSEPIISTIPMSIMAKLVGKEAPEFSFSPITVKRFKIHDADTFQTVYFPDFETNLYRASITKDLLICEYIGAADDFDMLEAFGLKYHEIDPIETTKQSFGKIAPIDEAWRKKFIYDLSTEHNIFSLGRFGVWKNLLLDDVLSDISVIKRLMNSDIYERSKHNAK